MPNLMRTIAALLLSLGFLVPAAWADVSRDEAVSLAQRTAPGRVLAVEHGVHVDSKLVWRVRMLTKGGELRLVVIDAETGRLR
ncbi:PepSY domain-containing protein [Ramlibacter cellulosilyticus]|nr:PepSY domain-containing protein [Ramlibacter cellulosilyticus]